MTPRLKAALASVILTWLCCVYVVSGGLGNDFMTIPEFILGLAGTAILGLQAWMMLAIVNLKVDFAKIKGILEQIERNI